MGLRRKPRARLHPLPFEFDEEKAAGRRDHVGGFRVGDRVTYVVDDSGTDGCLHGVTGTVTGLEFPGEDIQMVRWVADDPKKRPAASKRPWLAKPDPVSGDYWCSEPRELFPLTQSTLHPGYPVYVVGWTGPMSRRKKKGRKRR